MRSRAWVVGVLGAGIATALGPAAGQAGATLPGPVASPSASVDTRIGTAEGAQDFGTGGGAGATYPGAVAPFGMVQLSPDTYPGIENPAGGYSYSDHVIKGFSLTHLSGAGCAGLSDVPLLPTTHAIDASPSVKGSYDVNPRYVSTFSHRGEVARPGDYQVTLGGMRAETTAVRRAGALRVTFPRGRRGSFLVNAGGSAMGNTVSSLKVDPRRREISGTVASGGFCYAADRYTLHFVVRFDHAFKASGTWRKQTVSRGGRTVTDHAQQPDKPGPLLLQYKRIGGGPKAVKGNPTKGAQAGAYATFADRAVTATVAISTVSVDGARRNLVASTRRAATFARLRVAARAAWARQLGRVEVEGGYAADRTMFYTSLYHAQVMPNVVSDVDGRYTGEDGRTHVARGFDKYSNISGWDTYRSQMPLMAMLDPDAASDLVRSMVADQRDGGALPKWSALTGQTNVMVGDPADLLIAGADAFGARAFPRGAALAAMVDGATRPRPPLANGGYVQRAGLDDYLRLGYVGFEQNTDSPGQTVTPTKAWGTASTTLEYALADFGIARVAAAAGDATTCSTFATRAGNWRNVFDPATGLMQPRSAATGAFVPQPADGGTGFVEGTAAQYTWFVPQDVAGLVAALGGPDAARARLGQFFTTLNAGAASDHAFLGNEPTLLTPALYSWLGAPSKGAAVVRQAMLSLYKPTPGGFPGNDDGGQMSAWWAFGALGLAPAVPGTNVLTLSAPLFPKVTLHLAHGATVEIATPLASHAHTAIAKLTVDGRPQTAAWLPFTALARPNRTTRVSVSVADGATSSWGTAPQDAPPSFGGAAACAP